MTQIWPIYEVFGHTPVMPFFEPPVRSTFDRLPERVLRDERYRRRVLDALLRRLCPEYVFQERQLGYGLPMGMPGYPDTGNMEETMHAFSEGPIAPGAMRWLFEDCKGTEGAERFNRLRRLWTVVLLHAWLANLAEENASSERKRDVWSVCL